MNCGEADELLGAYAIDALRAEEAAAVREHLAGCDRHAVAAELRAAAGRLAAAAEPIAPDPSLRARVLDAIAVTPQDASPADAARLTALRAAGRPEPRPGWISLPKRRAVAFGAIAAVLVAAVVGLAVWNITLRGGGGSQQFAARATLIAPLKATNGATGSVIYYGGEHKAVVVVSELPPLDASKQTYQLWSLAGGKARSLGTLQADAGGSAVVVVPLDTSSADTIALTVEPAGGSPQPTTAPVMSAPI